MRSYVRVSPPAVHQMVLTLETHRLIEPAGDRALSVYAVLTPEELQTRRS